MNALPRPPRLAECESKSSLMVRVNLAGFHDDVRELGLVDVYPMLGRAQQYTVRRNELQAGHRVHEPIPMHPHRPMALNIDCFPMTRTHRAPPSATLHRRMDMEAVRQWAAVGVAHPPIVDRRVRVLFRERVGSRLPKPIGATSHSSRTQCLAR